MFYCMYLQTFPFAIKCDYLCWFLDLCFRATQEENYKLYTEIHLEQEEGQVAEFDPTRNSYNPIKLPSTPPSVRYHACDVAMSLSRIL